MTTPCLLALDTSTDLLCVALRTPGGARCTVEPGGPLASARLIPAVMQLLADAGLTLAGLQAIAYGQGPGAFTGLRTACAVTQGLALAHDTPVLAIDSLLIVAEDARAQAAAGVRAAPATDPASESDWWVAMDARMDEVYAAAYQHQTQDRAAALLRLAQAAWAGGRSLPADQALPLYLRDKVAFTSAERLAMAKPPTAHDQVAVPGATRVPGTAAGP